MIIDGVFKSLPEQVEEYQNLLKARVHKDLNGGTDKQHVAFNLIL